MQAHPTGISVYSKSVLKGRDKQGEVGKSARRWGRGPNAYGVSNGIANGVPASDIDEIGVGEVGTSPDSRFDSESLALVENGRPVNGLCSESVIQGVSCGESRV